jgi:hypothetical protein
LKITALNIIITRAYFSCPNSFLGNKLQSNSWDLGKFVRSHQILLRQCNQGITKKQRTGGGGSLTENGNVLSDSDKEHGLTKYYACSTALANSPEEKKRREHRSKRFEQSQVAPPKSGISVLDKVPHPTYIKE